MRAPTVLGACFAIAAAACSVVAGVDFGDAHDAISPGAGDDDAGLVALPDAAPAGCTPDQKSCNGACVSRLDPNYGCGADGCVPCSVPFGKGAKCTNDVCAPDGCATGHDDCDNNPANGCEADLLSPLTCGNCATQCPASAALCAPGGCVASCPAGTMNCNGSCVDTTNSANNCGTCGKVCNAPTNGDPACLNSTCAFACHVGYGDCTHNPATTCDPLPKWYADTDGDHVGGATSVQACAAPAGYVATSGDCLDTNAQVFPGNTQFYGSSYTNAAGIQSFDYDCSGAEVEDGDETHFMGCNPTTCDGDGYTPKSPPRTGTGAGTDVYCGSTIFHGCVGGAEEPVSVVPQIEMLPPDGICRAELSVGSPIACH